MRWTWAALLAAAAIGGRAEDTTKPAVLTPTQIADGWLMLFDGETTFGWTIDGEAKVENGALILGGARTTTATTTTSFNRIDYRLEYEGANPNGVATQLRFGKEADQFVGQAKGQASAENSGRRSESSKLVIAVPAGGKFIVRRFLLRPANLEPLFNEKDLTGWKQYTGDPKRERSKFSVSSEGWLSVKDGPGDLQTEKQFADFVLQAECRTNGKHLNSGIFFRALPGQYQQGYEAQIHNGFKDGDRAKPMDFGTGAIYRRVPARRVVANDNEWFTMTVAAHGNHIATWVNGYQTVDFTDPRPAHDNARNGAKTGAGVISIQGHDPTTDLAFRNIRLAELPKQ